MMISAVMLAITVGLIGFVISLGLSSFFLVALAVYSVLGTVTLIAAMAIRANG